jgi:PAS domain S-box-containing protein
MWIGWGPQLTFLYNDAYLHVLGPAKHPHALGRPASEVWAEIWDVCGPLADKVFERGEATFVDDVQLFMDRGGFLEETFYSFSYSPIRDDSGLVCGLFCPSTDVTPKVLNARRLATLSELASNALVEKTVSAACATASRTLEKNSQDVPFALIYLADAEGTLLSLERSVAIPESTAIEPPHVDLRDNSANSPWPLREAFLFARRRTVPVRNLHWIPAGLANQRVAEAMVLPVTSSGEHRPYGVLVCGVNPARPLDAEHVTFFELVAGQLAAAIQNARVLEEERKRAEMLAELDRAKTAFFSNVSHEFRTPLTLMLGPLEGLLAKKDSLSPDEQEQLNLAYRNSLRLLKLVNSLLDFSRIEAGRVKAWYTPVDLAAVTADLASTFRSALEAAALELVIDCPLLSEPVYVDREMWEKIVLNLLSNAFKFTFQGRVIVRVEVKDRLAVFSVSDTGTGIPEAELPRLFERFHRIEGSRGRTYEGTGIGLALVQELVKLHGGTISADSRVNQGTTFTVSIPLGSAHLPKEQVGTVDAPRAATVSLSSYIGEAIAWLPEIDSGSEAPPQVRTEAGKARVLVADDNADMREHLRRILGEEYDVLFAKDGREALETIRAEPPDLLVTDIMMPALDGFELLKKLRSDPGTQSLPVIFLSARAGGEMRVEGLEAGADDYLVKPFTANELRARVGTHIRVAHVRKQSQERETALRVQAEEGRDRVIGILENITDGYVALDRDWRITYVNAEAERINGMGREEMLRKNLWELFPQTVGTKVHQELRRAAAERVPVDFENYYEPWQRWFHVKASPSPDGGIGMFFEDITLRKRAEEAVRQSEESFRAILETTPECVKLLAPDGTVQHMNASGLAMLDADVPANILGKSIFDVIAPEFREQFRKFHESICHGNRGSLEFDLISLKGIRRHMETHAAPFLRPDGSTLHLAITRDATERARRERTGLLLSAIVDSSDDAIVSKDLNGVITSWNKGAERLFGYTAQEVVGKSITLIIPEDRLHEEPEILARLRRGERLEHFETIRRRKDGTLVNISLMISPMRDSRGVIIGASKIARDVTEAKRGERAALLLSAIVESSDDAIISKDLDGIITSWNKSAERLFGYSAEEAVGKPVTILIPEDRQAEEPNILARIRRGERLEHFETIRRRKDGALLNISLTISPIKDAQGRTIGASKIARDITEQKRNEVAFQALNRQLTQELSAMLRMQQLSTRLVRAGDFQELLGEIIEAGMEITAADMGHIQLVDAGTLKVVAHRGFDTRFLDFFDNVHNGEAACGTALSRGERVIVENVSESPIFGPAQRAELLAAGAAAVQSTPLISRAGRVLGIFSTHYREPGKPGDREIRVLDVLARQAADVIERYRAHAELLASESRFRQLADSMPQIVWTARPDGYIDYFNERWYEFSGFPRDIFGDQSWEGILHPEDLQACRDSYDASIVSGNPYTTECRFWDRHADHWRWFMIRALPVRDEAGAIVKWFGTSTDIDANKIVEEELRRANSDLEQFAFSASHDLQEPLRNVKIYSELLSLRYGHKLDGQAVEFCNFVRQGASRMELLVRDLLAYTQVTKLDSPVEETDANESFEETLANLKLTIAESGATITREPLPRLRVHSVHLKQLFQNLISNAIKYRSPERAPIVHISASRQDGYWVFAVRDNGIGIDPQYKERIFGLFKRLHTGDQYSGTGIGLAICQRIVERYRGRIWVESEPGKGATFIFTVAI